MVMPDCCKFSVFRIALKCRLTFESVRGVQAGEALTWNSAQWAEGLVPRVGSFKFFTLFQFWKVLDHYKITWSPGGANVRSP